MIIFICLTLPSFPLIPLYKSKLCSKIMPSNCSSRPHEIVCLFVLTCPNIIIIANLSLGINQRLSVSERKPHDVGKFCWLLKGSEMKIFRDKMKKLLKDLKLQICDSSPRSKWRWIHSRLACLACCPSYVLPSWERELVFVRIAPYFVIAELSVSNHERSPWCALALVSPGYFYKYQQRADSLHYGYLIILIALSIKSQQHWVTLHSRKLNTNILLDLI